MFEGKRATVLIKLYCRMFSKKILLISFGAPVIQGRKEIYKFKLLQQFECGVCDHLYSSLLKRFA